MPVSTSRNNAGSRRADLHRSCVGIGLRAPHVEAIMETRPALGFLEVHAENYMAEGPRLTMLDGMRRDYPVSLHGVGLSLGSAEGLDATHLARLAALAARLQPAFVSEHLSWSVSGGVYLNDLIPLPYTEETLALICRHVDQTQEALGRRILIENPSSYLRFAVSTIPEAEFLAAMSHRTGCGILLDINNIVVSSHNLDLDPETYLDALPVGIVEEIHLAGHAVNDIGVRSVFIDDHGSPVPPAVWALYARALRRFGPQPTLIEWDSNLPPLETLLAEAAAADDVANWALEGKRHG